MTKTVWDIELKFCFYQRTTTHQHYDERTDNAHTNPHNKTSNDSLERSATRIRFIYPLPSTPRMVVLFLYASPKPIDQLRNRPKQHNQTIPKKQLHTPARNFIDWKTARALRFMRCVHKTVAFQHFYTEKKKLIWTTNFVYIFLQHFWYRVWCGICGSGYTSTNKKTNSNTNKTPKSASIDFGINFRVIERKWTWIFPKCISIKQ